MIGIHLVANADLLLLVPTRILLWLVVVMGIVVTMVLLLLVYPENAHN